MKIKEKKYYEISVTEQEDKTIRDALRLLDEWSYDDETRDAFDTSLPSSMAIVDVRDALETVYNLLLIEEEKE